MSPRIDAHVHLWQLAHGDYGWLEPTPALRPICKDFTPADLTPHLAEHAIDGVVLVQAAPTVAETQYMLGLSDRHDFVHGVVGWADFAAEDAGDAIARLAAHPRLKGLRPMIQDIPDADWMLRPGLEPAYWALIDADLAFDALTLPHHLGNLRTLLTRYPEMRAIVDHGSKPAIREGAFDRWAADMASIARETGAYCKLSGLVTEARSDWTTETLRPYVDHLVASFGPERLIWGSDWPVLTLAGSYARWAEATDRLLAGLTGDERAAVLGGNAARFYRL